MEKNTSDKDMDFQDLDLLLDLIAGSDNEQIIIEEETEEKILDKEKEYDGEIMSFVTEMMKGDISELYREAKIEYLKNAYEEKYRHSYYMISSVIYQNLNISDNSLDNLATNIDVLIKVVSEKDFETKIYNGFKKLCDHIHLEIIRIDANKSNITEIKNLIAKFENESKVNIQEIKENTKKLEADFTGIINKEVDKFKKKTKKVTNEIDDIRNNIIGQVVAILGVFSAIVLAFTGGMGFSTSAIENMNNTSAYRITLVCLIVGFSFFNAIAILVQYLDRIVFRIIRKLDHENESIWSRLMRWSKNNCLWIVVNVIFIIVAIVTLYKWDNSNEKALFDESYKYQIEMHSQNTEMLKSSSVSDNGVNEDSMDGQ